ncbi:DUF1998 domain-containing protein [Methylobacterium sp. J-068]|uniref:DUF1998 domain-containing protein n=1 Tax=Methylobacterium sp. J-068 TaxID=2836649 RepID=UPI001FBB587B|nr:DUF1998 domain-containing protein [Methylobacterium sp. J-068]MCJ2032704.1 DUF1998 domain-containing protein [Methylobacterium sp. J-068]
MKSGFKGRFGKGKAKGAQTQPRKPPRRRPIRRSQVISPFGIGAINDFRNDEALMCAGLDQWFPDGAAPDPALVVNEERLEARLGCSHFRKPPDFGEGEGSPKVKIPHVRFPLWHYCPRCFRMGKTTIFGGQPQCTECKSKAGHGRRMIPVRIVAICEHGHIEDFPFQNWIGCACSDADRNLFFEAGRSAASLAGIKISCDNCKKTRSLAGSFDKDALTGYKQCGGAQPWLGRETGVTTCGQALQTVQRGGANVYFPLVTSSIYIPPTRTAESDLIARVLDNPTVWRTLTSVTVDGKVPKDVCTAIAGVYQVDADALGKAVAARLAGSAALVVATTEEEFRKQEYDVLRSGGGRPQDDLFVERIEGSRYGWLGRFVTGIGLVRKLRETRVHVGFSRLMPQTDRGDPAVQPLGIADTIDWLPAIEVRGEGIFVELRADAIEEWLKDGVAGKRVRPLIGGYNHKRVERRLAERPVDARFIMIQTLAHALIKELTFTCGYGSSSLRERLYCSIENPKQPMNGFLIYTASGDSEGTLGGLVAQAAPGRFETLVHDALARASWCSNDPVCMESPDGGAFSSNLAACHSCVLLPETSCEEGNRLLDRALLAGTFDDPDVGFFRDLDFSWAQ